MLKSTTNNQQHTVYWMRLLHEQWALHIAATSEGLCYVGSDQGSIAELEAWVDKHLPTFQMLENEDVMRPYRDELVAYLAGHLKHFTLNTKLYGTPFQQKVWQTLGDIPYGQTVTYSYIADRIGKPSAVRAAGGAIGANPLAIIVPCHRVIGKSGQLTGYRGGLDMKQRLLQLEQT